MKKLIAFASLSLMSLSADYHDPSITFSIDNRDTKFFYQMDIKLHHQSTFEVGDHDAIILHGLSNPRLNNTYHHEVGVGFRRMYENFAFGTNVVYANQYAHSFFNHHLVPGLEFFYKHFSITYNRYLPFKTSVKIEDREYLFHDVSEISLSYRPMQKYEFSFTPHFNHQTKRFGYGGAITAFIFKNWKLSLTPYCEPFVQHGVAFSVGYHLGGATEKVNRRLFKSHRFFYTSNKEEIARFTPPPSPVIMPSVAPIVIKTDDDGKPNDEKHWWDNLFNWKSKL